MAETFLAKKARFSERSKITETGSVKGSRCKAIANNWRSRNSIGDAFCKNQAKENGFCTVHQFLAPKATRGTKTVMEKYRRIGEPLKIRPEQAMMKLVSESAGNVEYLRQQVREQEKLVVVGRKTREEITGLMQLYNEERDRHERFVVDAMRVRLEERSMELDEKVAELLANAMRGLIDGLSLMGEERRTALALASQQLKIAGAKQVINYEGPLLESRDADPNSIDKEAQELAS